MNEGLENQELDSNYLEITRMINKRSESLIKKIQLSRIRHIEPI
jgi:hypothetical protein